jgi:hypothetical protein
MNNPTYRFGYHPFLWYNELNKEQRGYKTVSISRNAVDPADRGGQLTEEDGYMIVARDLLQGVEALSTLPPNVHPRSCAMLAAHALECVLKAFLWHRGKEEIRGHNLVDLWKKAHRGGLSIPKDPPDWVTILSSGHGPNYYFRYQEGEGGTIVHGGQWPELISMRDELKNLIKTVELSVKS